MASLLRAAASGDVAAVERALWLESVHVDYADAQGDTALSLASQKGHLAVVETVLAYGASVVLADRDGDTPLLCACWEGFDAIVAALLHAGSAVDHVNTGGVTALMCASENGHSSIVDRLLLAGASVDATDKDGDTALMCALLTGHEPVVRRLLVAGADLHVCNFRGDTPRRRAQQHGFPHLLHLFDEHERSGQTLSALVENGCLEDVKAAMAARYHGDQEDDREMLAHTAAQHGRVDILQLLVDRGMDVQGQDTDGRTPLHVACGRGDLACARLLIAVGVQMDRVDVDGLTPLDLATRNGTFDVVYELYRRGATLTNASRHGQTILHRAVLSGNTALVSFLLQTSRVDINAADQAGWTPLHYAVQFGSVAVIGALLLRGADPNTRILTTEIDSDASFDSRLFPTALHMAVRQANIEIVSVLTACGRTDLNARNAQGETPAFIALSMGVTRVFAVLVQLGADMSVVNTRGESLVSRAAQQANQELLRLVLEHTRPNATVDHHERVDRGDRTVHLSLPLQEIQPQVATSAVIQDRTDDESDSTPAVVAADQQCQYRGGKCSEPRTTKINGTLHKLCHVHRIKQNEKKRRSSLKRRDPRAPKRAQSCARHDSPQCQYAGHPCKNPRDVKPNGEHHLFCALHRKRHNLNQQSVDRRRRGKWLASN